VTFPLQTFVASHVTFVVEVNSGGSCIGAANVSGVANASSNTDGFPFHVVEIPALGQLSAQSAGFIVTVSDISVLAVFLGFVVMFRRRIEDFGTDRCLLLPLAVLFRLRWRCAHQMSPQKAMIS
jgi:hypothetical protein